MSFSVIIRQEGRAGRITLNRKSARHALNHEMSEAITAALKKWKTADEIELVFIDHIDGTQGFCAGSDVKMLAKSGRSFGRDANAYLQSVYQLFHTISTFPKPFIAIMDGATSGHGIGLSINGNYRIATDRTAISFPETSYGSIPDGGATRFLSGLPSELGTWLALTGSVIEGEDVVAAKLATHYCAHRDLHKLKEALSKDGISALTAYEMEADPYAIEFASEMERYFAGDCVKTIRCRLAKGGRWALAQARKLDAKSPLSSKIALRQLRTGRILDTIESALKIEYRIQSRLVGSRNFQEGVRAKYIDMDHCPLWRPISLNRITTDMVGKFFSPLPAKELSFGQQRQLVEETT